MKSLGQKFLTSPSLFLMAVLAVFVACDEEYDHTVDVKQPMIISFNPLPGVEEISVNSVLVLTFDEPVKKGKGSIQLSGEGGSTIVIDVTTDAVILSEDPRVVTIRPGELESDMKYTVSLDRGTFTDLLGNEFMGSTGDKPWTFTTAGDIGPLVVSTSPENGENEGSLIKLEMTFLSDIQKGTGNISIFTESNSRVAEIAVSSNAVMVQGKKVTVYLGTPLEFASTYYVTIDNGAITDLNGKRFKGYKDPAEWRFTTTAGNQDGLVVHLPLDSDWSDISGNKFDARPGATATAIPQFISDPQRGKVVHFMPGSYAVLPKHNLLRPSNSQNFSFSMWLKLKGIGSDPVIFSNSDWDSGGNPGIVLATDGALTYTGPGTPGRGWLVKLAGGGRMDWRAGEMTPQAPALADDKWHMVTIVIHQDTKLLHVYIDGKEYMRQDHAASRDLNLLTGALWDETNDYPFTLWEDGTGGYNAGSDTRKELDGYMDDLRIFDRALSADEVDKLFKNLN